MDPASLAEFPTFIWAIQDIAQAAAVPEHQCWKHIQRLRKAKFGFQAFFLPPSIVLAWSRCALPKSVPITPSLHELFHTSHSILLWSQIHTGTAGVQRVMEWNLSLDMGEAMGWQGWSISMAEMMLSCAVPPIPSWSLDPNVTNVSAFYGSERGTWSNRGEGDSGEGRSSS